MPKVKAASFDATTAGRGQHTSRGGRCSICHVPPRFMEPGWNVHKPTAIGIDDFQTNRSRAGYRTAPLRSLMMQAKGGFYHDHRVADLAAVVDHCNQFMKLALNEAEKRDLMEYLKLLSA